MRLVTILLAVLALSVTGFSATWYVPDDYGTIQEAIDVSMSKDIIVVKPGTYVENIDFLGKDITVKSEQGSDVTLIDGNMAGSVVTCQSGEGLDSVLDGFTITNGSAPGGGGGMYNTGSDPTVSNCNFLNNRAVVVGGGMYNENSHPTVTNCIFSNNNIFFLPVGDGYGGGMYNTGSSPTVTNCTFSGNRVEGYDSASGGGMYNHGSDPTVTNCTFTENCAIGGYWFSYGGGMCNEGASPTVTNCTFSGNNAALGGGISCLYASPTITNTILWDNNANVDPEIFSGTGSNPTVTYCCIQNGYPGTGNIDTDPLFVDPANNDFHLTWLSPCINRGTNNGAPSDDIDGDPRPYMGTVDMGADEFVGTHPLAADIFSVSEVTGGTVNFTLTGGLENNARKYIILGGVSGTAPGIPLPGGMATLPINWDAFTDFVLALLNTSVFSNFLGTLNSSGTATAQLNVPPVPGFAPLTMHYAYALNNPWDFVSNPVAVEIVQ